MQTTHRHTCTHARTHACINDYLVMFSATFFAYSTELKSWPDAKLDCEARGLMLAIIKDSNENDEVLSLLQTQSEAK